LGKEATEGKEEKLENTTRRQNKGKKETNLLAMRGLNRELQPLAIMELLAVPPGNEFCIGLVGKILN